MPSRPWSYRAVPSLLAVCLLLALADWYLDPAATRSVLAAVMFLGVMAVIFLLALDWRERDAGQRAADMLVEGMLFGSLMIGTALFARLGAVLGAIDAAELGARAPQAVMGAFLMSTGNMIPKALSPITAGCSGARTQAFQRLTGRTWVVVGLAYAIVWLELPIEAARIAGPAVIATGIAFVITHVVRLRRGRSHPV